MKTPKHRCKPCQMENNKGLCDRLDCSNHYRRKESVEEFYMLPPGMKVVYGINDKGERWSGLPMESKDVENILNPKKKYVCIGCGGTGEKIRKDWLYANKTIPKHAPGCTCILCQWLPAVSEMIDKAIFAERERCIGEINHVEYIAKTCYNSQSFDDGVHQVCARARRGILGLEVDSPDMRFSSLQKKDDWKEDVRTLMTEFMDRKLNPGEFINAIEVVRNDAIIETKKAILPTQSQLSGSGDQISQSIKENYEHKVQTNKKI